MLTWIIVFLSSFLVFNFREILQKKLQIDYILFAYISGMLMKFMMPSIFSNDILQILIYGSIPLAIPLLIFKADFRAWLKYAPMTVKSFFIACLSTFFIGYLIGNFWLTQNIDHKIIAMLVGVFIGGTPNLNAIGLSLQVPFETIAIANTVDLMASSIFLIFMLFLAKPIFRKILPYPLPYSYSSNLDLSTTHYETILDKIMPIISAVFITVLSIGTSYLLFNDIKIPFIMLMITVLGVVSSYYPKVRQWSMSETYGNYFITVFCFATALILDIKQIFNHLDILFLASFLLIFASMALQLILARIFKINAEVMMIVAIACVMSPAFVPMFVKHYQREELLLPGITTGLAGFALGNLIGLGLYAVTQ